MCLLVLLTLTKMQAVILAAGMGTRMLPLTETIPKVLVEVNGKPFLYYVLKNLQAAGIEDFVIVVGYMKEKIEEFLQEYNFFAKLVEQEQQLGTGDALMMAKDVVEGDFIMLGGDNLWPVEDFKKFLKDDELNYISGVHVDQLDGKYGVIVKDGEFLKEVKEKPVEDHGNLINAGMYKFKQEIFSVLEHTELSERGELELTDGVNKLAEDKKVKVLEAKWWLDLGSKEDIPKVEAKLKELNI